MTRVREYTRTLSCEYCGGIFNAASAKAKYCCTAHRTAAKRKADRVADDMNLIKGAVDRYVGEFVRDRKTRSEAFHQLEQLKAQIDRAVAVWESELF